MIIDLFNAGSNSHLYRILNMGSSVDVYKVAQVTKSEPLLQRVKEALIEGMTLFISAGQCAHHFIPSGRHSAA